MQSGLLGASWAQLRTLGGGVGCFVHPVAWGWAAYFCCHLFSSAGPCESTFPVAGLLGRHLSAGKLSGLLHLAAVLFLTLWWWWWVVVGCFVFTWFLRQFVAAAWPLPPSLHPLDHLLCLFFLVEQPLCAVNMDLGTFPDYV